MSEQPPRPSQNGNDSLDTALVVGILSAAGGYVATGAHLPLFSDGLLAIGAWLSRTLASYGVPHVAPTAAIACLCGILAFVVTAAVSIGSDPMERHAEKLKARRDRAARRKLDRDRFIAN